MTEEERPARHPLAGVAVVTVAMAAAAVALHVPMGDATALARPAPFPSWVLAVSFLAAEVCVVHLHVRRQAHTLSLTEIPLLVGVVFFSPLTVLGARLAGSVVALAAVRRQRPTKLAFNLSWFALETGIVSAGIHASGLDPLTPGGWAVTTGATLVGLVVGSLAISLVIATVEGEGLRLSRLVRSVSPGAAFVVVLGTVLGLLSAMVLRDTTTGWVLLAGAGGAVALELRAHAGLRERHQRLERAYSFTTDAVASLESGDDRSALLNRACEVLRASWAEVAVGRGADALVLTNRGGTVRVHDGPDAAALAAERLALLGSRPAALVSVDGDDGVAAALPAAGGVPGTFLVADRLGSVDRFGAGDVHLLEALAAQAAVVLRNRALLDRIRRESADREHRAMHDALTRLPNRQRYDVELQDAVRSRPDGAEVAVLLVDLDGFKEVNDTLGHQQGDALLTDVAGRLAAAVPDGGFVARLAGDEFAVVLRRIRNVDDAVGAARRLLRSLDEPFVLDQLLVDVRASVGVATCPTHGDDATTLLQRADVAMYAAKANGSGVAVYDAADDRHSRERLGLVAELRSAIERGEVRVEFQPVVELATGRAIGAEALCRWHHRVHGLVPPDVFIPLAEASGLIRPLTEHVLAVSVRQLRAWRAAGHAVGVSVNLSRRNLADDGLPDFVAALLDEHGVPASAVTLEVTEGSVMAEPAKAIGILNRLSAMGLRLSIDDFGTGYSSLSQLHELPVDELKIDRAFVLGLAARRQDIAIVRAIADLGRALDLEVTAEGIEDGRTLQLLAGIGCDNGQGFHIARPMTPAVFDRWLTRRREEHDALADLLGTPTPANRG